MNPTHDGGHFNQGGFAPALKLFILRAGVVFAAGCSSLQPGGDGIVARDVLEIKHLVESHKDEEASSGRKVEYRLDSLDEKLQSRTEMLKTNVADLDKIIRDQAKEIEKLRRQVEELGYQLSAVAGKLGVAGPQPAAGAPPAEAAPPAGGTAPAEGASGPKPSVEDQFMEALKQFNLGRYELARKGSESVLASGAAGEQPVQPQTPGSN
ncbi:hypothetical protein HY256_11670 [Candidatus Sumerlaeota bacterium]|nr:hypothetical protein [Candidatus Sumerlaeota bacterium]